MDKDSLANKLVREILARIFAGEYAGDSRLPLGTRAGRRVSHQPRDRPPGAGHPRRIGRDCDPSRQRRLCSKSFPVRHSNGLPSSGDRQGQLGRYPLRPRAIETAAAVLACKRISAAELKDIETLIARMEAVADDLPEFLKFDMAFHEAIIWASGNRPLITAFEAIREYHRYFQVFTSRWADDEHAAVEHHRRILNALRRRNAKAAAQAVRRHLDAVGLVKARGKSKLHSVCPK